VGDVDREYDKQRERKFIRNYYRAGAAPVYGRNSNCVGSGRNPCNKIKFHQVDTRHKNGTVSIFTTEKYTGNV
jgi:hypothetical protein